MLQHEMLWQDFYSKDVRYPYENILLYMKTCRFDMLSNGIDMLPTKSAIEFLFSNLSQAVLSYLTVVSCMASYSAAAAKERLEGLSDFSTLMVNAYSYLASF